MANIITFFDPQTPPLIRKKGRGTYGFKKIKIFMWFYAFATPPNNKLLCTKNFSKIVKVNNKICCSFSVIKVDLYDPLVLLIHTLHTLCQINTGTGRYLSCICHPT